MKNYIVLISISMLLFGCGAPEKNQDNNSVETAPSIGNVIELNTAQINNSGIQIGEISSIEMGSTIQVTGSVEVPPQNKTAIGFPYGGTLSSVKVLDGMNVTKGQTLMTISDPALIQLQEDYLDTKSQLDFLEQDYNRQKSLNDQQVNSGKTFQQAKSAYFSMQAKWKGLKLKLELAGLSPQALESGKMVRDIAIKAPFNGVVSKLTASVGHYVTPQETVAELIDLKHCHVELFVFEKDIPKLKIGQSVKLTLGNGTSVKSGTLFLIGRDIGPDHMVKVHCHLDKEDNTLIPGSFVNAVITVHPEPTLAVPTDAIGRLNGKDVVFTVISSNKSGKRFEALPVKILSEENGFTGIRFVQQSNEKKSIVLSGAYALISSILLKTQPKEE